MDFFFGILEPNGAKLAAQGLNKFKMTHYRL